MVIDAHLWGSFWARKQVLFRSDNEAVVTILTTRTSKLPDLMHLLRDLLYLGNMLGFYFHCCSCSCSWEKNCWRYLSFPLAGVQAAGSGGSFFPLSDSSAPAEQLDTFSLEQWCLHFLTQGLAASTRKAYAPGQRKFVEFCSQAGKLYPNGSPCPAEEWALCLFVSFLAGSIKHSSIKV